ncbi:MAG: acetyl-CoA C-acyltransferase [Alphaproteobacteria bacterium]|nr:acetyl-CoA C-acyltransferase [Alphaproteobacteria bacterium]
MSDAVVIVGAARTPMGGMLGDFANAPAVLLGATAIEAAMERAKIKPEHIAEVIMGCVLAAGQGQAPARQAARAAGVADASGATTVNKMCGSGMKAVMLAHDALLAGSGVAYVAGGMENMSNAPYLLPKARAGMRMGHGQLIDHMFFDGLEDAYDKGRLMGSFAEECANRYHFTREAQDAFAIESLRRALAATEEGKFTDEISPVALKERKGERVVAQDEQPAKARPEKIPQLKPAFRADGTVTAANASSISDGAAALVLMRESDALAQGLTPLARIVAHASHARAPSEFAVAPVGALQKLLQKANWSVDEVDLWEINEAFAVVTMAAMHDLKLDHAKVNVHGGACALGHPIGASGARILVTLLYALQYYGKTKGVATLCIGGGEATAMAIERLA